MSAQQTPPGTATAPEDVVSELLESRRCCHLIDQLAAMDGEAVTADLTAAVCAVEKGCSPTEIDQSTRQEAREELFEHHIPKLAATGVVEYDSMLDRLRLRATGVAERAESELAAEGESPGEAQ